MNTNFLGVDLGMSSVKLVGAAGALQFLSQAALYGGEVAEFGGRRQKPTLIEGAFGRLYVGSQAHVYGVPVENLGFERLAGSTEVLAVFYGALSEHIKKHGEFAGPLSLVVGLPFQMLMGETNSVASYKKQVTEWMVGAHRWQADGKDYDVDVANVHLFPQAMAAPVDFAFDIDGNALDTERVKALQNECATISIGSNTVELLVTKRDKDTKRFNGGKPIGVRSLWRRVDPQQYYSFGEFDEMLRTNTLPEEMDVKPHLASWKSEILGFANTLWGQSYHRFHKVFLVGGGAILLKSQLRREFGGKAELLDDPVMVIGRGLYKAGFRLGAGNA
jgi:hypothetical protein